MPQNPRPGYRTVTPQSIVPDPGQVIAFLETVFGATLDDQFIVDDEVIHAEMILGDSRIMIGASSDEYPPLPLSSHVYVADVDAVFKSAIRHGATAIREPADQFYGDRAGVVQDGQGNQWSIATAVEDVSREEMHRRMAEMSG